MHQPGPADPVRRTTPALIAAVIAALFWLVLVGTEPTSWIIGLPCVLACAAFGLTAPLPGQLRLSLTGWLRLIPFFLWHSLVGGWDVARRVLSPSLPVRPGYTDFDMKIAPGAARTFFVQFIGLLPGTLAASLEGDVLRVHILNPEADHERSLRRAERRVAAAFAVDAGH